eukprot:NODE_1513_length_924_cov_1180.712000_g1175_i0.p1 GENE.NODE_1513_length_924_cov_1180.712000_g1175_i0~~NODE_1513_length_924_cov_1180.712000_g1175_i0.p1  ORF type:complete len:210 (-),score=49.35 NODE_1513_length_924_cov_1180.712000_g1175_i0:242-871(-)
MVRKASRLWKGIIIDGRSHLLGRLASTVAKQLLKGNKVCVVRCEAIEVSGSTMRNKMKWLRFWKKKHLTNPKKGPFHWRSPHKVFWKTVRSMMPYKTPRGKEAMRKLKCFNGIPPPWDKKKRMCCPQALRALRMAPGRDYTVIGDLMHDLGWKNKEIVQIVEKKRKLKSAAWWQKKMELNKLQKAAVKIVDGIVPKIKLGDPRIKIGSL